MSKRVVIKGQKSLQEDMNKMSSIFEEMVGTKDARADIVIPKLVSISDNFKKIKTLIRLLIQEKEITAFMENNGLSTQYNKLMDYTNTINTDFSKSAEELNALEQKDANLFYNSIMKSDHIKKITVICYMITPILKDIQENNVNIILEKETFYLFENICDLDVKLLYKYVPNKAVIITKILNRLYISSKVILDAITSPNIDISEFSHLFVTAIAELKNKPELRNCDAAINLITNSIDLLKNNLPKYYQTSIITKSDGANIYSDFFTDVMKSTKRVETDKKLSLQFARVISFVKKHAMKNVSNLGQDKTLSTLFKMLDGVYSDLKEKTHVTANDIKNAEESAALVDKEASVSNDDKVVNTETNTESKQ